jgi:fatty-acyl-CoA synthase
VTRLAGPPFDPLDLTLPDVLDAASEGAFVDGDIVTPYTEVAERSQALAGWLVGEGVAPGDRVALLSSNRVEFVVAHYAVARAGAIAVPLSARATPDELERVLVHAEVSLVFAEEEFRRRRFRDTLESLRAQVPSLGAVAPLDELDVLSRDATLPEVDCLDPTLLIYTSGTTGAPKGCLHAHRSYVSSAAVTAQLKELTPEDRILASVPFFNAFGIVNCVLEGLHSGASIVMQPAFETGEALRLIEEHRVSVFLGTPTMWIRMLEHPDFERRDLSSLRTGTMAGAPAPPEVIARWRELGCDVMLIFGLSEATSILANGWPTPGIEVEVEIDDDGELRARGFNQMLAYYKNDEATRERFDDGWIRTGDLAEADASGRVRVLGRADDMLIVGGFNLQPAEVEDALRAHPAVADAAVFGLPDDDLGEVPAAWVILRPGAREGAEELAAACRERLASYKVPRDIRLVDEFPLTANGKVRRFRMRAETLGAAE